MDQALYLNQRERYLEFEGIAEALGVPTSRVIAANYAYEYVAFCTSIIAKEKDGSIMHMRILDFISPDLQKNQTFIGEFYRGGKLLYSAVMTGGTPTFPTGFKQGAFSISLNQRNPTKSPTEYLANLGWMASGYAQVASVLRDTLEKCDNFTCALSKLQNDYTCAPVYFILAGTKDYEGVIISRDQEGPAMGGVQFLNDTTWYLVQTNQDHFKGDCPERCKAANDNFQKLG